jgi:hypothetical protein
MDACSLINCVNHLKRTADTGLLLNEQICVHQGMYTIVKTYNDYDYDHCWLELLELNIHTELCNARNNHVGSY